MRGLGEEEQGARGRSNIIRGVVSMAILFLVAFHQGVILWLTLSLYAGGIDLRRRRKRIAGAWGRARSRVIISPRLR